MNVLLDTHIVLWAISNHPNLSKKARELIMNPDNNIYYSSVSTWEVLLKCDSPKNNLKLTAEEFEDYCVKAGYYQLNMLSKHVIEAQKLHVAGNEKKHKDPFDRMLLAQAKSENFVFVTHDQSFLLYNEKCVIKV